MYSNYVHEYSHKIQNGEINVGAWIKIVYAMVLKWIADGDVIFDAKKANRAIRFIETFSHHSKGRNDLIKLELWQKAAISLIFGVVDSDGLRVFREVFIVMGRKNGKTLLASAIMEYMAYADGEYGAELYCLAPKLEQANIVFDNFYQMILLENDLGELSKKRRSDIYIEETNTTIKPLAFNAKKSDGFNPHMVTADEVASWEGDRGLKQYEVMSSALGSREQPLILSISTAGYVNDSIYDELMGRGTAVLKGASEERRFLPLIYMIDDIDKWDDIEELKKANPNMGVSVKENWILDAIKTARTSPSKKVEFITKTCNIKQNSCVAWLEGHVVESANINGLTLDDFKGCYAVGGIDLSQSVDLTAASVVIERDGKLYGFTQFFMPEKKLKTHKDNVPYEIFVNKGIVTLSGKNVVNYNDVLQWFKDLREKHNLYILKIGYDKHLAWDLVGKLNEYGYHTDDVHQGENLMPVIQEFEGTIKDGDFYIVENNLMKGHLLNVALKHNMETRKFRPIKIEQRARIDGFVSTICCITMRHKYGHELGALLKNAG